MSLPNRGSDSTNRGVPKFDAPFSDGPKHNATALGDQTTPISGLTPAERAAGNKAYIARRLAQGSPGMGAYFVLDDAGHRETYDILCESLGFSPEPVEKSARRFESVPGLDLCVERVPQIVEGALIGVYFEVAVVKDPGQIAK